MKKNIKTLLLLTCVMLLFGSLVACDMLGSTTSSQSEGESTSSNKVIDTFSNSLSALLNTEEIDFDEENNVLNVTASEEITALDVSALSKSLSEMSVYYGRIVQL